jgi:drug/metabolite transporter (DMT)-like permease
MQAGLVQLAVPALAALSAVVVLGEPLTAHLALSALTIFAGLLLAIVRR